MDNFLWCKSTNITYFLGNGSLHRINNDIKILRGEEITKSILQSYNVIVGQFWEFPILPYGLLQVSQVTVVAIIYPKLWEMENVLGN